MQLEVTKPSPHTYDLVVVVRVNTDCSLSCAYCGFSRDLQRKTSTIRQETLEGLGQSLASYQTSNNRRALVSWLGGEPFQWAGWLEWTRNYVEKYNLAVSITTNGLALGNSELRAKALRWFDEITISLDGFSDDHDRMRKSPGLFERLRATIESIVKERDGFKPLLRINSVLTHDNIARFGNFCRQVGRWGVDELTFNQLGGNDRPDYFHQCRLTPADLSSLVACMPAIQAQSEFFGLRVCSSPEYLNRLVATTQSRRLPILDCSPGTRFLFVDENGYIGPCSFTAHQLGIHMTDMVDAGVSKLPEVFRQKLSEVKPTACMDCHATHVFRKFH